MNSINSDLFSEYEFDCQKVIKSKALMIFEDFAAGDDLDNKDEYEKLHFCFYFN